MCQIYDFESYHKERALVALEAEALDLKKAQKIKYVSNISNNDDGLTANIGFELIPDDEV